MSTMAQFLSSFSSFSLVSLDYFVPCASVAQLNSTLALQTHSKVWLLVFRKQTPIVFGHSLTGKTQRRHLVSNLGFSSTLFYYISSLRNN